jgi:hypothetical protein
MHTMPYFEYARKLKIPLTAVDRKQFLVHIGLGALALGDTKTVEAVTKAVREGGLSNE